MKTNPFKEWSRERTRLVVRRITDAGLEFKLENVHKIVDFMSYENQSKLHPEDCPCYVDREDRPAGPCHNGPSDFNCFLCACPYYNTDGSDENGEFVGGCKIGHSSGKWFYGKTEPIKKVWDCSDCTWPHQRRAAENHLSRNVEKYAKMAEEYKSSKLNSN